MALYDSIPERPMEPPEEGGEPWPVCPVCGEAADTLYRDIHGDIVGCFNCLQVVDAWEVRV